ncbi:filamentation induced by cAMP protein fic [Clostridium diolis]|uniref:Fic family protein n=1 Tax=Clostridium diolis TaxID=223919 RepID=UPI000B3FB036|nr:Fic family protein [Clostridium diolis]MBE6088970.1 filamentation induced by cAMP protein fic [Clostridium beijerinckii]OVE69819.1 filamentation induced by cAMP protein fic [Clostridium diolis]
MLFERNVTFSDVVPQLEINKLIILIKRLLPDVVFNMASLEGNPFTYPEVQTLLDGITIGGHRLSDEQQVLRIKEGWNLLFEMVRKDNITIGKELFNDFNKIIAKDEALICGQFRTGQVRIGGTDFMPPQYDELEIIFANELPQIIDRCKTKTDLAFEMFLWGALNQFYYDGNKRTSRLVCNYILLSNGQGVLNVKAKDRLEFNTLMLEFYNTRKADNIVGFFYKKCLERYV